MAEHDWSTAWLTPEVAHAQALQMQKDFRKWDAAETVHPLSVFHSLARIAAVGSLLDVGCGAGVYSAVWDKIRDRNASGPRRYLGVDQSKAMIYEAAETHPNDTFIIGDASNLPIAPKAFDLVLVGGLVNCTEFWEPIVADAVRVSRRFVMLHRVPCYAAGSDMQVIQRDVYGKLAPEREFNATFFNQYIRKLGTVVAEKSWDRSGGSMCSYLVEIPK